MDALVEGTETRVNAEEEAARHPSRSGTKTPPLIPRPNFVFCFEEMIVCIGGLDDATGRQDVS
jgi:hypothetical protein